MPKKVFVTRTFDSQSEKRISYILTTKNRAGKLQAALERLERIKRSNDEVIIVDGNSKDETGKIVKKFSALVDRYVSEEDCGIGHAFNKGILTAKGRYIKNLSDDDEIYPQALERAVSMMDKNPDVGLLVCGGIRVSKGSQGIFYIEDGVKYGESVEDVFKWGAPGAGFVIRRSVFALIGLTQFQFATDLSLVLSAIAEGIKVKFCRVCLFKHKIDISSATVKKRREWEKERRRLLWRYCTWEYAAKHSIYHFLAFHPVNLKKVYKVLPFVKFILLPINRIYRRVLSFLGNSERKNAEVKPVWDGGFS